jgi:hypothetical protein
MQRAMDLEREAEALDRQRKQAALDRRTQHSMPRRDEVLSRQEREARIWAFMYVASLPTFPPARCSRACRNHKPSESDAEDDDDDDDDDDDPAGWFEDDQDDGRKGQDLVQPDVDEPDVDPSLIRIDYGRIYEMRDGPGA